MSDDDFELSRRKALAAVGTIGVASAGAGLGTSAYFSDQETFENNRLVAGTLDLKVGWQEHYSNWMDDDYSPYPGAETTYARMPTSDETPDVYLPPGPAQSDAEPIQLVFVDPDGDDGGTDSRPLSEDGGRQFLRNTKRSDVNGGIYGGPASLCETDADAQGEALIEVADLKPGDWGFAYFRLQLCDNPGYLWLNGSLVSASENGVTEPESDDPDEESGTVELLDEVQVAYGVGTTNDVSAGVDPEASPNPRLDGTGTQFTTQSTLREFLNALSSEQGIPLDGDLPAEDGGGTGRDCFSATSDHYLSVFWWLPIDHGNEVQSDSATFDLGFYTEQCRHNDGSGMNADEVDGTVEQSVDISAANVSDGTGEQIVDITVGSEDDGEPLTRIDIDYEPGTSNPGTFIDNVQSVTLNGTDVRDQISGSSQAAGGLFLAVELDGSSTLAAGDRLVFRYDGVENPSSGTATVSVNGDGGTQESWGA
jgi:predicted ribosomally synthesized peptide with SipW-like signal peptide